MRRDTRLSLQTLICSPRALSAAPPCDELHTPRGRGQTFVHAVRTAPSIACMFQTRSCNILVRCQCAKWWPASMVNRPRRIGSQHGAALLAARGIPLAMLTNHAGGRQQEKRAHTLRRRAAAARVHLLQLRGPLHKSRPAFTTCLNVEV